jgi:2'-5' RNA ligase
MGYAVELYFDSQTEKNVWNLRHILIEQGISSTLGKLGDKPHISLAVFSDVDCDSLISLTEQYASKIKPFDFQLNSIDIFPTDENVLFLSPVITNQLLKYHRDFHHRLAESKLTSSLYYIPANWTPHCTVEMNIPNEQFSKAVEVCQKAFKPLFGQFREIGVVEFRPIKHLRSWSLVN